ncbi:MAG: acyltransferase [Novosphingobium sp.]|nr:acyltransferase [Novosphingobium sp.]
MSIAHAQAGKGPAYRPDIDGLRAIAVSAVVLYHAGVPFLKGGFAGVDVFFVISGFLIGTIIFQGVRAGTFSFADFYARRARRIIPALVAVILATIALGAILLSAAEYKSAAVSALSALLAISNIRFERSISYFTPDAGLDPLLMTWSLGVEEQFYLLLPFIFLVLARFGDRTVIALLGVLTLASLGACLYLGAASPAQAFYLLPYRAWELGIGVMLGVWVSTGGRLPRGRAAEALGTTAMIVLCASLVLVDKDVRWPGPLTVAPVLATAALIATPGARVNRKLLGAAPMVGIGLISYSWYLWHWPLMAFLRISAVGEPRPEAMGLAVLVSLIAGWLSWRYIEMPFRTGIGQPVATVRRYGAAMGAVALSLALVTVLDGFPDRVPAEANRIDRTVEAVKAGRCMMDGDGNGCQNTDGDGGIIVLIGDSHAAALAPAVVELAKNQGKGWAVFSLGSCRPLSGVRIAKATDPGFAGTCEKFTQDALAWTAANPRTVDVILAGMWEGVMWNEGERYVGNAEVLLNSDQTALLGTGLGNSVHHLVAAGKRVHVAQDTPYWLIDPARAALSRTIPARYWLSRLSSETTMADTGFAPVDPRHLANEAVVSRAVREAGGRYFATNSSFCSGRSCRYRSGDTLYFADRSHLSPEGAMLAMSGFAHGARTGLPVAGETPPELASGRELRSLR